MKKNNNGFALMEMLVICVIIMASFFAVYVNFYPLLSGYEQRITYNDIISKYSLFNMKKIFLSENNEKKYEIRKSLKSSGVYFVNLLADGECNSDYLDDDFISYCNQLVLEQNIEELIVTNWNIDTLKVNYGDNDDLKKYIHYLPSGLSSPSFYRIIAKTNSGYAYSKFDIDLLQVSVDYSSNNFSLLAREKKVLNMRVSNDSKISSLTTCFYKTLSVPFEFENGMSLYYADDGNFNNNCVSVTDDVDFSLILDNASNNELSNININDLIEVSISSNSIASSVSNNTSVAIRNYNSQNYNFDFEYIGREQEIAISKDGYYKVTLYGGNGGRPDTFTSNYGNGAKTSGEIYLNKGEKYYFYVGQNGYKASSSVSTSYNGGGNGYFLDTDNEYNNYSGGGATDMRLENGAWDDFSSLKSRIMVAAGGGGYSGVDVITNVTLVNRGVGGGIYGNNGTYVNNDTTSTYGKGATQVSAGLGGNDNASIGSFGAGGNAIFSMEYGPGAGGGGGYYGGGAGLDFYSGGGGGSSYISGYAGVNSVNSNAISSNITHSNLVNHYSNKYFKKPVIDISYEENPKANIEYVGDSIGDIKEVRYILDCSNGTTKSPDAGGYYYSKINEIQAISNGLNVAKNKLITSYILNVNTLASGDTIITNPNYITDGKIDSNNTLIKYSDQTLSICVAIDLGQSYPLDQVLIVNDHNQSDYVMDDKVYVLNDSSISLSLIDYELLINKASIPTAEGKRWNSYGTVYDGYVQDNLQILVDGNLKDGTVYQEGENQLTTIINLKDKTDLTGSFTWLLDGTKFEGNSGIDLNEITSSIYQDVSLESVYVFATKGSQTILSNLNGDTGIALGSEKNAKKTGKFFSWGSNKHPTTIANDVSINTKNYVGVAIDSNGAFVYKQDDQIGDYFPSSSYPISSINNLFFGCTPLSTSCNSNYFNGNMYSVRVYNTDFDANKLEQNYQYDKRRFGL